MNPHQAGFVMGLILGGLGIGPLCGLIPLALASQKNRLWIGLGGCLACIAGGLFLGMLLAIPLAVLFAIWIARSEEGAPPGLDRQVCSVRTREIVLAFLISAVFLSVFWSFTMTLSTGTSFLRIFYPLGLAFGLLMGIFMAMTMLIATHTGQLTIAFLDRNAFLVSLKMVLESIRFTAVDQLGEDDLVFELGARFRVRRTPPYGRIRVHLDSSTATITGPWITIRSLRRKLERTRSKAAGSPVHI